MKQYIMGMLTGASLILCAVMFMGANAQYTAFNIDDVYLKLQKVEDSIFLIEGHISLMNEFGVSCN